jgi:hypothetical protein
VNFSGTGELGDGEGAVFGSFTNTGSFPDGTPSTNTYSTWDSLGLSDYYIGGGSGGGGAGGDGQTSYQPTVTAVSPNSGSQNGGTSVTITGSYFTTVTQVNFGTTGATSFTINSDTSITATSPSGTGIVDITVTNAAGYISNTSVHDQFTYTSGGGQGPGFAPILGSGGHHGGGAHKGPFIPIAREVSAFFSFVITDMHRDFLKLGRWESGSVFLVGTGSARHVVDPALLILDPAREAAGDAIAQAHRERRLDFHALDSSFAKLIDRVALFLARSS